MFWASFTLALLGLWRLIHYSPRSQKFKEKTKSQPLPKLSVIIPARNEEMTLPRLLKSLAAVQNLELEIVVVNDHSEDSTADVAKASGAVVIQAPKLPPGWAGKNWACWQGAQAATGEYLLFTDADTEMAGPSLRIALQQMINLKIDLMSSVPEHLNTRVWEYAMGSFQYLVLLAASAFSEPRTKGLFAIGQFLLFRRESYFAIKGHEGVKGSACDDIPLAQNILNAHMDYEVSHQPLYRVRMYDSFLDFIKGWRRNFVWGFQFSDHHGGLRVLLSFFALTGAGHFFDSFMTGIIMAVSMVLIFFRQRSFGYYPLWSVFLVPVGLLTFCVVSLLAYIDLIMKRPVLWKGRSYSAGRTELAP